MVTRKICKVKPDVNECYCCIDRQIDIHVYKDCSCCDLVTEYELLNVGQGFLGKEYAYVLKDGRVKKVLLDRVFDIRDVREEGASNG